MQNNANDFRVRRMTGTWLRFAQFQNVAVKLYTHYVVIRQTMRTHRETFEGRYEGQKCFHVAGQ